MHLSKKHILGLIGTGVLMSVCSGVLAHGYVTQPASRGFLCADKEKPNGNCGHVQYEPQSLEASDGYPEKGPADGKIASAGVTWATPLDVQTADRWAKTTISPGENVFTWKFTANHRTLDWRYFITKDGWNQQQVLTRDSFDAQPFCSEQGHQQQPPMTFSHTCQVPANKSGYHVILAVWDVGDTAFSFYNVLDVNIDNANPSEGDGETTPPATLWAEVGAIHVLSQPLTVGQSVHTRVFKSGVEQTDLTTGLTIETAEQGLANAWPHALASKINAEQSSLKAGMLDAHGVIEPVFGLNTIYTLNDSGITRVEVQINAAGAEEEVFAIDVLQLQNSYSIKDGAATITFAVSAQGEMQVKNQIYDANNKVVGFNEAALNNETLSFAMEISNARAETYTLVTIATTANGKTIQESVQFKLVGAEQPAGDYDYVFPDGIRSYKAGTRVLQPKTNKVYTCKQFPYSGYCVQWSQSATQFEPGFGSHWNMAWVQD